MLLCDPALSRTTVTWAEFLRSQAEAVRAMDFIETVTLTGARQYILAAVHHAGPALIDEILSDAGIATILTGVRVPRMNAIAEHQRRRIVEQIIPQQQGQDASRHSTRAARKRSAGLTGFASEVLRPVAAGPNE